MTATCSSAAAADITIPTKFHNRGTMKRTLFCIFVLAFCASLSAAQTAQTRVHQQGTIVRMRMTDCLGRDARIHGNHVRWRKRRAGVVLP